MRALLPVIFLLSLIAPSELKGWHRVKTGLSSMADKVKFSGINKGLQGAAAISQIGGAVYGVYTDQERLKIEQQTANLIRNSTYKDMKLSEMQMNLTRQQFELTNKELQQADIEKNLTRQQLKLVHEELQHANAEMNRTQHELELAKKQLEQANLSMNHDLAQEGRKLAADNDAKEAARKAELDRAEKAQIEKRILLLQEEEQRMKLEILRAGTFGKGGNLIHSSASSAPLVIPYLFILMVTITGM